jgi:spore coat polysaccharide biosynthesis protein SpsF
MRIVATIEARMTSSRLPGKVLMPAGGKPMLQILIERLQRVPELDAIVLATTINATDDGLAELAERCGIQVFRGSEENVLGRVCGALSCSNAEVAVEITGDCPFIDPDMVSSCIQEYLSTRGVSEYVANTTGPTLGAPHGLDVQVFRAGALHEIERETINAEDREHVSIPFYRAENHDRWHPRFLEFFPDELSRRVWLSLDYPEDYALLKKAYESISPANPFFSAGALVDFCLREPAMTSACLRKRGWA